MQLSEFTNLPMAMQACHCQAQQFECFGIVELRGWNSIVRQCKLSKSDKSTFILVDNYHALVLETIRLFEM